MIEPSHCIVLSQLTFKWPGANNELLAIDHLHINHNETLFIHGASGSGKSTFLNLLTGVLTPSSGSLEILGQSITGHKNSRLDQFRADHFGIIFQQFNLLPYLSVLENILLPLSFSGYKYDKVRQAMFSPHQQGLDLLSSLGLDANEIAYKNITQLSTGQQQRAAAARALIGSPEIIIADEPTSALDEDAKYSFLEVLFHQIKNTNSTLIFVSHDRTLSTMFDRTISVEDLKNNA